MAGIMVLCTANQCRSPVGGGFLRQLLDQDDIELSVTSAGFMNGGIPAPAEVVQAASRFGLDLSAHRSRQIDWSMIREANLIVTMTRQHVREVAVHETGLWHKTFTIRELIRRGSAIGSRSISVPLETWIDSVHEGRTPTDLQGSDPTDEVADPMNGIQADYDEMAETLYGLTRELVQLIWPRSFD